MRKRKEEREVCATFLVRDSQNKHGKHQEIEECKRHKRRRLQGYLMPELS